jgi:demethylmenaquinone methyltransferase / 2-methoxy-6-polyprenyl-1,4-benzoquinol methylase
MFGTIASRYDFINHVISFNTDKAWRKKASRLLAAGKPSKILDAACGTADLALALHERMPHAEITGIDISAEMLELGRKKIESRLSGLSKTGSGQAQTSGLHHYTEKDEHPLIKLLVGNAEALEFEDSSFDAVTISFGIRNIRDRKKALKEMHRVLRDRGMLMVLEFSLPRGGLYGILYKTYFYTLLPFVGGLLSGNFKAYRYLVRSVRDFPSPVEFVDMLIKCGFHIEYTRKLSGGAAWIYLASRAVD